MSVTVYISLDTKTGDKKFSDALSFKDILNLGNKVSHASITDTGEEVGSTIEED